MLNPLFTPCFAILKGKSTTHWRDMSAKSCSPSSPKNLPKCIPSFSSHKGPTSSSNISNLGQSVNWWPRSSPTKPSNPWQKGDS